MEKIIILTLITILGALLGSFTTMLIHRLHFDETGILTGRSQCPNCKKVLRFWNLIPIFSWLFQRGKCQYCHKNIAVYYPLTEITFATMFLVFGIHFYSVAELFPLLGIVFITLIFFFYDVRFMEVDDRIAYPAILFIMIYAFFREDPWVTFWIGGIAGFAFYAFQYFVSRGKWVGAGDMRLGAFMGLCLGWKVFFLALFFAYILGLLFAIPLLLMQRVNKKTALPMGAFLMPSLLYFLYSGETLLNWYLTLGNLINFT